MKKRKKEKSIWSNRLLIRILYYVGFMLLGYIFWKLGIMNELEPPLYEVIVGKLIMGGYLLFGMYLILVYNIPLFSRQVWFGQEDEFVPGVLDFVGPVVILLLIIVIE